MICIFFTYLISFLLFDSPKPKVVIFFNDLNTEYWKTVKAGATSAFGDYSINGIVISLPNEPVYDPNEILDKILSENPDLLIYAASHPRDMLILDDINRYDIPILLLGVDYPWENKVSHIGTDNIRLGKTSGLLLSTELQPGDKAAIIYSGGDWRIGAGAQRSLEEVGIKIVAHEAVTSEELRVKKVVERILYFHPDLDGIIASNDTIAVNAYKAIENQGLDIPVVGADGMIDMIELIKKDAVTGTAVQNPYDIGYLSIQTAMRVLRGEEVEKHVDTGIDIITTDNADLRLNFLNELLK